MGEQMMFPDTWEEYEEFFGFTDREEIYTNGGRLIPSFRVKQWLDHLTQTTEKWMPCSEAQPKQNGEYLVTLQFKWAKEIDIGEWLDGRWIGLYADDIVAWMDLPEVWEEGSDES